MSDTGELDALDGIGQLDAGQIGRIVVTPRCRICSGRMAAPIARPQLICITCRIDPVGETP